MQKGNCWLTGSKPDNMRYRRMYFMFLCIGINTHSFAQTKEPKVNTRAPYLVYLKSDKSPGSHQKWTDPGKRRISLKGNVDQGEIYTFEIGILAKNADLKNLRITSGDLLSDGKMGSISKSSFLYNDTLNNGSSLPMSIEKGDYKIIHCSLEIPKYISSTKYRTKLSIKADRIPAKTLDLEIDVSLIYVKKRKASDI